MVVAGTTVGVAATATKVPASVPLTLVPRLPQGGHCRLGSFHWVQSYVPSLP